MFPPNQVSLPRNRMLRPRILEALGNRGQLNAAELAGMVYGSRRTMRSRPWVACTTARLVATRRALRRLVQKGKVVTTGRYRGRKRYCLPRDVEAWRSISLETLP